MNQSHLSPWLSSSVGGCRSPSHKCTLAFLGSSAFSVVMMNNSHMMILVCAVSFITFYYHFLYSAFSFKRSFNERIYIDVFLILPTAFIEPFS